jgi:ATP-binding cassette subfamily F protein uup
MNLVTVEGVSKQYSERQLLDQVDLLINEGDRIGLIGLNGSGKTTLLRLVAGLEPPDEGKITVWGGVRIGYLPQDPQLGHGLTVLEYLYAGASSRLKLLADYHEASNRLQGEPGSRRWQERLAFLTAEMERTGGWSAEAEAKALSSKLGVSQFEALVETLSGGQHKRVALARALLEEVDLLILDEPTNHIDADTVAWLEEYLLSVPGALLMVTHDRYFLDRVVNRIVELDRRQLVNYPGSYSRYLELSTRRQEQLAATERKQQNLLRRELAWLQRGAMARSTKQKARKQRVQELQQLHYDSGQNGVAMALAGRRLGKKVLEAHGLSKSYDDLQLFENVDFSLDPGDRIGIIGPNGAGKSTLLDILAGWTEADAGEVIWGQTVELAYYDQLNRGLDESLRVIDFINDIAPLIRTDDGRRVEAAQMLEWFLFPRPQQQAYIGDLSGGERRRLYLLSVLARRPNVLFLDEPTNDLDIQTLTVLEEFMDHFQGCLVVVSHDRYFLDRNVDFLATFEDGSMSTRYPGPFSNYQERRQARAAAGEESAAEEKRQGGRATVKEERAEDRPRAGKLTWKEARELEGLETQIAELEQEKQQLSEEVNQAGGDYELLGELAARLADVEAELDRVMERWLVLSERI